MHYPHRVALPCVLLSALAAQVTAQSTQIPDYVTKYAPVAHLDVNELFLPSDIGAQLINTTPDINFTKITDTPSNYGLDNLSQLNSDANCTVANFGGCPLYLTAKGNITTLTQDWLYGVLPDSEGATNGAISSAVIVNDHGNGVVDAFYFYFYAFNLGLLVLNHIAGNHVGDWEHTMIRFNNSKPQAMWYSAHSSGFTYTYDVLEKKGVRPVVYPSLGGHANYPTPGAQERNLGIIQLNDTTSVGPFWDPIKSAYFYTYSPTSSKNGTFRAGSLTPDAPVDWLYFLGRWGDEQYPDSNPAQYTFPLNLDHTWDTGPTGPLDKDLNRTDVCPNSDGSICVTTTTLPAVIGQATPSQTINHSRTATVASTTAEGGSSSTTSTSTLTSASASASASGFPGGGYGNATSASGFPGGGHGNPTVSPESSSGAAPTHCRRWALAAGAGVAARMIL